MTIPGYRSDIMMAKLDRENLEVSSGSACGSGSIKPSKVLREIGHKDEINVCTLRISFGRDNSSEDIDRLANQINILNTFLIPLLLIILMFLIPRQLGIKKRVNR